MLRRALALSTIAAFLPMLDANAEICPLIDKARGTCRGANLASGVNFNSTGCPQNSGWKTAAECGNGTPGVYGSIKESCEGKDFYERCKSGNEYCADNGYSTATPDCTGGQELTSIETCSSSSSYKKWDCACPSSYNTAACADGQTDQLCSDGSGTHHKCTGTACSTGYTTFPEGMQPQCPGGSWLTQTDNLSCRKCVSGAEWCEANGYSAEMGMCLASHNVVVLEECPKDSSYKKYGCEVANIVETPCEAGYTYFPPDMRPHCPGTWFSQPGNAQCRKCVLPEEPIIIETPFIPKPACQTPVGCLLIDDPDNPGCKKCGTTCPEEYRYNMSASGPCSGNLVSHPERTDCQKCVLIEERPGKRQ